MKMSLEKSHCHTASCEYRVFHDKYVIFQGLTEVCCINYDSNFFGYGHTEC